MKTMSVSYSVLLLNQCQDLLKCCHFGLGILMRRHVAFCRCEGWILIKGGKELRRKEGGQPTTSH
jgi:hypothetical protein